MTQVLLVSTDDRHTTAVAAVVAELEGFSRLLTVHSALQGRIEIEQQEVDIVLVDEEVGGRDGLTTLREISSLEPLLPVCLLSSRPDSELIERVLDAGGRGLLPLPPSVERYAERLRALSAWTRAAQGRVTGEREQMARAVGSVVAVVGAKGGVGASLTALVSARATASRGRTALVDFDLRAGDLASYCGVTVRRNITDLASLGAEIGGREISEVAYPVRNGIELLPAPEHGELAELMTETAARQIVQAIRYQYAAVVVDCGSHLDDATAAALDLADVIVVVATPEVPALRAVRRLGETLGRLTLAHNTPTRLVLNRTSRNNEIQPATAARLVSLPLLAVMPDRIAKLEPSLNTGSLIDLALPELNKVGQSIARATWTNGPPAPTAGNGRVGGQPESDRADDEQGKRGRRKKRTGGRRWWRRRRDRRAEQKTQTEEPAQTASPRSAPSPAPRSAPSPAPRSAPSPAPRSAPSPTPRSAPSPAPRSAPSPAPRSAPSPTPRSAPSPTIAPAAAVPPPPPVPATVPPSRDRRAPRHWDGPPSISPQAPSSAPASAPPGIRPGAVSHRRGRRSSGAYRRDPGGERGAVTVEFVGSLILALVVFVICLEGLILGGVSIVAHNASQEAARGLSRGMTVQKVEDAVARRMPGPLADGLEVTVIDQDDVQVAISFPSMIPGMGTAYGTSRIDWEGQ